VADVKKPTRTGQLSPQMLAKVLALRQKMGLVGPNLSARKVSQIFKTKVEGSGQHLPPKKKADSN
jgi:hypothetical protein